MNAFRSAADNWKIVGDTYVNRSELLNIDFTEGSGILINTPSENNNSNLLTKFEHGDIELEVDVMLPVSSNSGLYFQGRYEIQIFDSWGRDSISYGDMGGIYERWDTEKATNNGFEGYTPQINASKAPGLWQRFKILFQAPKFDEKGEKIKNARFEEVWLNGMLIHNDIELSGPTRAALFSDERELGPLMIQGDHGPIALKNLKYKLYEDKEVSISELNAKEYESPGETLPNMATLQPLREFSTDTISATMFLGGEVKRILDFNGKLNIPTEGDYLFELNVNSGGALFILDKDTILNRDGNYMMDSVAYAKVNLTKGNIPFKMVYNKHNIWQTGFSLFVEGPGLQKQALHAPSSIMKKRGNHVNQITVDPANRTITQRGFLMHKKKKRTHCITVGTPEGINYSYDLNKGALLSAWKGDFIDASEMWHSRGTKQLMTPLDLTVMFHGDLDFAILENNSSPWPKEIFEVGRFKSLGYEFDDDGLPIFILDLEENKIKDKIIPAKSIRKFTRKIHSHGDKPIWFKIGDGMNIQKLPDNSYIINDESYFVIIDSLDGPTPIIRRTDEKMELVVKIPSGKQGFEYSVLW
ncbi:3-keto-disaccharide hydrolase [Flagellimonas sp. 2504JD4-2]